VICGGVVQHGNQHPFQCSTNEPYNAYEKILEKSVRKVLNTYKFILVCMSKNKNDPKTRQTVTVDKDILDKAKKVCEDKHIPLSGVIENFLDFFTAPWVYCFKCSKKFKVEEAELCPKCGWMICPNCKICRCGLDESTAIAVFHMRKVYEDLLAGRVK